MFLEFSLTFKIRMQRERVGAMSGNRKQRIEENRREATGKASATRNVDVSVGYRSLSSGTRSFSASISFTVVLMCLCVRSKD
jgi:hypothetical protein